MIYRISEAARKTGFYVGEEIELFDLTFFDLEGRGGELHKTLTSRFQQEIH